MPLEIVSTEVIAQLKDQVDSLAEEVTLARDLLRKTWWLPQEGSNVAVYRVIDNETNEAIVQYLTLIGHEKYVPKKKEKP